MLYVRILNDFLFFFFALFVFTSTFSIAAAQLSLGVSLILFLIILILRKENIFAGSLKPFYIAIGLYLLWMMLSALFSKTPIDSFVSLKEEWLFFAVPIGVYILKIDKFRERIFYAFFVGVILVSLYGIIQHFTGVYWFKKTPPIEAFDFGYRVKGFFPHRLTFGNYFATASIFLTGYTVMRWNELSSKFKMVCIFTLVLSILSTLYSYSYGPILALLVSFLVLGFLVARKYTLYLLILLAVVTSIFIFSMPTLQERISARIEKESSLSNEASRIYIWDNALKMTKAHPLFGVGQGNFYSEFQENMPGHRIHVHAHNDFLNTAAIAGIPGFLFFSLMWILLFVKLYRAWKDEKYNVYRHFIFASLMGSIAFCITSLTEATFADEEVRQMLMFVWAFGLFPIYLIDKKSGNKSIMNL